MQLLIVCTGNICRSPMAEVVMRAALRSAGLATVRVASAGTWAGNAGSAADPRAVAAVARRGYDLSRFVARGFDRNDFASDLILGMTKAHVDELAALRPERTRCTIRRYLDLTTDTSERDIPDPYLGSDAEFERALDLLERGAPGIVAFVRRNLGAG